MANEQKNQVKDTTYIYSDNPPVDMSYILACIGDDKEKEQELVKLFIDQADICLKDLQEAYENGDEEAWKKTMHLLRGSAANMGAQRLSDCCKSSEVSNDTKNILIKEVEKGLSEVKLFFDNRK